MIDKIIEANELRVAVISTPSRLIQSESSEFQNIDQRHLSDFANSLGVSLTVINSSSYEDLHAMLSSGEVQIISGNIGAHLLSEEISYSPAYQNIDHVLIGRRQAQAYNADGTKRPLVLTIPSQSIASGLLTQIDIPIHDTHEIRSASPYHLLDLVSSRKADLTVINKSDYELLRYSFPDTVIVHELKDSSPISWALKQNYDDSLQIEVDQFFNSYEFKQIETRLSRPHLKEINYYDLRAFHSHYRQRLPLYIEAFKEAALDYAMDWELLAAMSYQESKWDNDAVSFTGVEGLMMLTRDTVDYMSVNNPYDPIESIHGGGRYFDNLNTKVPERISNPDRTWFIVAAYNLGFGHLEDARILTQVQGGNPDIWADVESRLSLLESVEWQDYTKNGLARGSEAINYVSNVRRYYELLKLMSFNELYASYN